MRIREEDIKENIELLFLLTLVYFPCKRRYEIAKIICKALCIANENLALCVEVECIIKERELLGNGYISKCYFDDNKHRAYDSYLSLTAKGKQVVLNNKQSISFNEMKKEIEEYSVKYYKERRIKFPGIMSTGV